MMPEELPSRMQRRFPDYASHPVLRMLGYEMRHPLAGSRSLCRRSAICCRRPLKRESPSSFLFNERTGSFPGCAVIRDANGKFVRLNDSTYVFDSAACAFVIGSSRLSSRTETRRKGSSPCRVSGAARTSSSVPRRTCKWSCRLKPSPCEYFPHAGKERLGLDEGTLRQSSSCNVEKLSSYLHRILRR